MERVPERTVTILTTTENGDPVNTPVIFTGTEAQIQEKIKEMQEQMGPGYDVLEKMNLG